MFRQRGWLAILAVWIILALYDPTTGRVPNSEKSLRTIVSREDRQVGREIVGKNSRTLTDGDSGEINRNRLKLGSGRVPSRADTLGTKIDLGSRKSRIKKILKHGEFLTPNDFYSSELNFNEEKLPLSTGEATGPEKRDANRESKKYAESKQRISQAGSAQNKTKFPVQRSKRDEENWHREKFDWQSSRHVSGEVNSKSKMYEEYHIPIPKLASGPALSELKESSFHRRVFEPGSDKAHYSVREKGSEKLKEKSSQARDSGMVKYNGESRRLGVSDKKMQRHERSLRKEKSWENIGDKEIDVKESFEFGTTGTVARARIVSDDEPTTESFNESNPETNSSGNRDSNSYADSDNQRKVESGTPSRSTPSDGLHPRLSRRETDGKKDPDKGMTWTNTTPTWSDDLTKSRKNDNRPDSGGTECGNFYKGESPAFRNSDIQEAIKCIGKTKSNKELPIELSAVNYAGYIGARGSDSNTERSPVPGYKREESYRRTDVARDMRREGDAGVGVAEELAYSESRFATGAEIRESVVKKIGESYEEGGIGPSLPAASSSSGGREGLVPHTPAAVVIQLETEGMRENSKSQLIKSELLKTSRERIHPRGEISQGIRNNLLQADKTPSDIRQTILDENLHRIENEKNRNENLEGDGEEFKALGKENRDADSTEIIVSNDHVQRKSLREIAVVASSSRKENEHPGIIETPNSLGYPRPGEKKTLDEMTTMLNIRVAGVVGKSSRHSNKESTEPRGDIQLGNSLAKVNAAELSVERNLSKGNKGGNGSPRMRIPKFLDNKRDAYLEITSEVETELFKTESRINGNDTDKFQFLIRNSAGPIRGNKIERNENVEGTRIDVRGKSSGNILSENSGDRKVIRNSKFTLRNSQILHDKVGEDEDSLLPAKEIEKTVKNFEKSREKLAAKEDGIDLWHNPRLIESNTDRGTTRDRETDTNETPDRTAIAGSSTQNGIAGGLSLTVNLLAGKKNDGKLRGEEKHGGDVSPETMGKKKTNLLDKLWGSKPEVGNLSVLDISGYGFITEIYSEVDPKNNDQAKLSGKIAELVDDKETFSKLKQSRKFPYQESTEPEATTPRFLVARLSDKYLASRKNKRAMKSSGENIIPQSMSGEKMIEETTASLLTNLEDEISIVPNKSETLSEVGSVFSPGEAAGPRQDPTPKYTENITSFFSLAFSEEPAGSTPKSSGQSVQLFPEKVENEDDYGGDFVSGMGNFPLFENSTEINVSSENKSPLFDGDNGANERPVAVPDLRTITAESNQTYSNLGNETIASPKALDDDFANLDALSSFPDNPMPTEIPVKTTLDVFEAITRSPNLDLSFNETESENSSHVATALNQWPVKHSAVVEGDLVLGGLMMVHEREDSVTCGPVMPQGGVQALEAMLYTLDRLNDIPIIDGVKIGAHILDDCDKDTYGLEMAVDFIKGSISNIDGAEYHCNKTAVRKVISGVVGAASSVTSIQVANLLRLFRIPQVSFFSTSPELSNKQRFEYFSRTIPSDHYQVKAMVDIVRKMNWSYVSIIYEESNYGIKAFEELEELLAKYDICIAIKEKLVKDSGVAEETAYDNIVQKLLTKPRARGCIIFGSDQEVAGVMRAVRRCNATGAFSWIGSDGWSARGLVSDGNQPEVEGTLSVQPQANPVKGFEEYFLKLTVENNRRNPWFVEFWEDHFKCRYPNASRTPYNQKYTKPCTTKERLTKNNTAFEDQLQFVSDAVTAFAYAFRNMHRDLCENKSGLCDAMKPTKGTELLKYLRDVEFDGLSGDKFKFDKNGDGPARYNIIHFKQVSPGDYKWVRVGEYLEGELRLNMSEIQFRWGHPLPPESVCSLPCEVGQAKKYVEGESCCWHCFNCTQYQVRHSLDETQCVPCRQGTVPDETHSTCRDIPEEFLRPESGWAIGAMSFSATGILVTLFVGGVFLRHNDTPVVRASGRELSYVLLTGILLCYLVTFALVLRPNNIVCGIQRFGAGFCFTVVYAALLTKTNRIARIFNAGKQSAKRPSFISPRSQLIICSGLMGIQILINGVWMIIDPAKAMHHYPTREDNLLVCSSYIDASYMIAFSYPIILIVVCTVYAVLTRKIPEAFNESKHIGFTMYTTCVIWLAFVPLYFGTGNHVALRITSMSVTISLSASVTIACLFSPKLYIILIRPERNVRQSMMPARYSTTKNSAVTGTNATSMMAAVTLTAATCDQNKAVKRHVATTIDCSTQSEHYEMEVKADRINGKAPANLVSRSTQTQLVLESSTELNPTRVGGVSINTKDANASSKENIKDPATIQQLNNVRIGNGPVSQKDGAL